MARGDNKCPNCGQWAPAGHRCVLPSAPPPGADVPIAPNTTAAPVTASDDPAKGRLGGGKGAGKMLLTDYQEMLSEADTSSDRPTDEKLRILIDLEEEATRHASSEEGYTEVLADAQRYLSEGNIERAAILTKAAEKGHTSTPEPAAADNDDEPEPEPDADDEPGQSIRGDRLSVDVDTFPDRMEYVYQASDIVAEWEKYYQDLNLRAGGTFVAGTCNPCQHPAHPDGPCQQCRCQRYTEPTPEQVEAYDAYVHYYRAREEWQRRIKLAREVVVGDRFRVIGGESAPINTCGRVVRTHPGKYGSPRAKLRTEDGSEVWVTIKHLTRNTPGFDPGVGDPR